MGENFQTISQSLVFFSDRQMFIHDKQIISFYLAQTAFHPNAGFSQIFFDDRDIQFFSKILKVCVKLFGFHDKTVWTMQKVAGFES